MEMKKLLSKYAGSNLKNIYYRPLLYINMGLCESIIDPPQIFSDLLYIYNKAINCDLRLDFKN